MVKRPFYTHPDPGRPEFSNSFDLLFRGLEIVTGGQRLHRYADYMSALDGETAPFEGYLQAFRYGMPPHGGFALGLERAPHGRAEHPRDDAVPARPRTAHALTLLRAAPERGQSGAGAAPEQGQTLRGG
jgi:nondiscriminating aspartyl-tRNA synthetase